MNPVNPPQNPSSTPGAESVSPENRNAGERSTPKQKITAAARSATEQIKRVASDTASTVKDQAQKIAEDRREQAARRLDSYSSAAHRTAEEVEREDPNIGWLAHRAADRLQSAANYVRNRDFKTLRSDAENYARAHPAVFFGGLFVAGLVLGNVIKATSGSSDRGDRVTGPASFPPPSPAEI